MKAKRSSRKASGECEQGYQARRLRKAPKITGDELAAAVEAARQDFSRLAEERPPGALSIDEWCGKLGFGRTSMRQKMNEAVAKGLYERFVVQAKDMRGSVYRLAVYRRVKDAVDRIR